MPRKLGKPIASLVPHSPSKRTASTAVTRQSKRRRSTANRSYVEPTSDIEDEEASKSPGISDYEASDGINVSSGSDHEEPSEDNEPAKAASRGRSAKRAALPMRKNKSREEELWKSGAKLEPGTQVIIKRPKAREAGDTPYADETIHPNTLLFLRDLAANNERQWLKGEDSLTDG